MKVTFTVEYSGQCHHTEAHEFDGTDYAAISQSLRDAVELHKLRYAEAKRQQAARKAECFPQDCDPTCPGPDDAKRDDGPHGRVWEYDGAYQCLDCSGSWGALPGNPEVPKLCEKQYAEAL